MGLKTSLDNQDRVINLLINSGFEFDQRTAGNGVTTDDSFCVDRWFSHSSADITQRVAEPLSKSGFALEVVSTATAYNFSQKIEARNFDNSMVGKTFIFKIQIKKVSGDNYIPEIRIAIPSVVDDYTVAPVLLQENMVGTLTSSYSTFYYEVVMTQDMVDRGMYLRIGDFTNLTTNTTRLMEAMFYDSEFGLDAEYVRAGDSYPEELQLCQRYFEKTYELETRVGTATGLGEVYYFASTNFANSGALHQQFSVIKRVPPLFTPYSTVTFDAPMQFNNGSIGQNFAARGDNASVHGVTMAFGPAATLNSGQLARWHWTADAEL